jgi:hypothetical protein
LVYCGEPTVETFLKRVGIEYPNHGSKKGGVSWLRDDLDRAIAPDKVPGPRPRLGRVLLLDPEILPQARL